MFTVILNTSITPPKFFQSFIIEINQMKGNDFYAVNLYIERDGFLYKKFLYMGLSLRKVWQSMPVVVRLGSELINTVKKRIP